MKKITFIIEKLDKGYLLMNGMQRSAISNIVVLDNEIKKAISEMTCLLESGVRMKIEIIATEGNEEYEENQSHLDSAKMLWQIGQKLEACKLLHRHGMTLKDAKDYCETNF